MFLVTQSVYLIADFIIIGIGGGKLQQFRLQFLQPLIDICQGFVAFTSNGGGNVILASLLAVILILSLAACGSSGNNTQNTEINANTNEPSNTVQPENTTPSSPTESSADNETQYMKGILIRR